MRTAWTIRLAGHPFDLEDQRHWTAGNAIHVAKLGEERYELVLPISDLGVDHAAVRSEAQATVSVLNGLGAMLEPSYEGVQLDSTMHCIDEAGQPLDTVVQLEGGKLRTRGGRPTVTICGQATRDPTRGMAGGVLDTVNASTAVRDALLLVGRPAPTWSELFVAYELVKANTGASIHALGWASKTEIRAFKRTANSYTALGALARHGTDAQEPPPRPMVHPDALSLIKRLVRCWVDHTTSQRRLEVSTPQG